jgi:hypothetical protein
VLSRKSGDGVEVVRDDWCHATIHSMSVTL